MMFIYGAILLLSFCFQDKEISRNPYIQSLLLLDILENNQPTPMEKIPQKEFTIYANKDWQETEWTVISGKAFTLKATGSWYMTLGTAIPPEGLSDSPALFGLDYRLDTKFNHGQLLCRISSRPSIFFSTGEQNPSSSGRIGCRINDTDLINNSGSLKISISP